MKKLIALVLALAMVATLGLAFAAVAADGSLTIDNAIVGESYTLYKIFDVTYEAGGSSTAVTVPSGDTQNAIAGGYTPVSYTYTKGSGTDQFFNAISAADSYFTVTQVQSSDVYTVVRKSGNDGGTDAQIITFMKSNVSKLPADRLIDTQEASNTTVGWNNLPYGYYYVESTAGSLVTIDSTLKDVTVKEKNTIPSDDKKVKDSGAATETWGTDDDAQIGDTVDFKLTVTDGQGTDSFITLHDKMSAGLTLKIDSFQVKVDGAVVDVGNYTIYVDKDLTVEGTKPNYIDKTVDLSADDITNGLTGADLVTYHAKDDDTFVIVFKDSYIAGLAAGKVITITYQAVLNDAAVVGTAETNKSKITYSNQTTPEKTVNVKTYDVDILKYANNATTTAIAGAVFQLQTSADARVWLTPGTAVSGYDVYEVAQNQSPDLTGLTAVYDTRDTSILIGYKNGSEVMVLYSAFVTTDGHKVRINGLDVDKTYKLEELEAPSGFNKLTSKQTVSASGSPLDFADQNIQNQSGTELPSTGGIGTTIFYILGGLLVVGAAVILVARRKASN